MIPKMIPRLNGKNMRKKASAGAVVRSCSAKKVSLKISQNSQESTCARVSFLTKLQPSDLQNRVQMNTKDLSGIAIVIRTKLQNTVGKQIITLAEIRRKLLIGKTG